MRGYLNVHCIIKDFAVKVSSSMLERLPHRIKFIDHIHGKENPTPFLLFGQKTKDRRIECVGIC